MTAHPTFEPGLSRCGSGRVHHQDILVQHDRLHGFLKALNSTSPAKWSVVHGELLQYFELHASDEEQFMSENDYPELKGHQDSHAVLLKKLREMGPGDGTQAIWELLNEHIRTLDEQYMEYFRACGLIPDDATSRSCEKRECADEADL